MWVGEFKVWHKNSVLLSLSEKFDLHALSQYLNVFQENGKARVMRLVSLWGKDKEKIIAALREDKRIEIVYRDADTIFLSTPSLGSFHMTVLDKSVFFLEPILEEGNWQYWKLGSNKKENLIKVYEKIKKMKDYAEIEVVSLMQEKYFFGLDMRLSGVNALDFRWWRAAYDLGYYEYPRKITLIQLAKKLDIPYTTLKDHLRKTELLFMKKAASQSKSAI
jgi:predicted DNA binding protein